MPEWQIPAGHDSLGILAASCDLLAGARHVTIDTGAVARLIATLPTDVPAAEWTAGPHWRGSDDETTAWIFVLDTLNFCFWPDVPGETPWRVAWNDQHDNGYWALVLSLARAMDQGIPLVDPEWLAAVREDDLAAVFRPEPGCPDIPLLPERQTALRELGHGWRRWAADHDDDRHPAASMLGSVDGSAVALVRLVAEAFPSFDDMTMFEGRRLPFYKRAQIVAADIAGSFGNTGPGHFDDLGGLTAFADYKVPQVLRHLGVLRYGDELAGTIAAGRQIAPGSRMEVEIRAGTVWGCELIRQELARRGQDRTAIELDWMLWEAGQHLPADTTPYHRTRTIFY